MSEEILTRKKNGTRLVGATASTSRNGRRNPERLSILANQKVERRVRRVDSGLARHADAPPVVRRNRIWNQFSGRDIGLRALEGSVFLVAGISMLAKNSLDSLIGMFKDGREAVGNLSLLSDDLEGFADDRLEPEWEADGFLPLEETHELMEVVEERKMNTLLEEETGLSSEILDDQAGALRSLITDHRG